MLNDTVTLNPSMLAFQQVASLSGTFNWINSPTGAGTPDNTNQTFNVSVIDGKNQYASAGLSFTRRHDADFVHVAVAKRVLPFMGIGLGGKRYSTRDNRLAATGRAISGVDGGASVSFAIPETVIATPIQIGLVADNLIHRASDEVLTGPRTYGGGVKVNVSKILLLYGDLVEKFWHDRGAYPVYSGGAEIAMGGSFYARGGLFGYREKGWSAGGGWVGPKLGLSYGYQSKREDAVRSFDHAVTMDIYM
ncbi:MAG TPA: hypothetical protein PLH57_00120 [Oligoflexia bacterium]|nr:hypothetical protein [Oligoflexia bacterium]